MPSLSGAIAVAAGAMDAPALPGSRPAKAFFEDNGFVARLLVMHRPLAGGAADAADRLADSDRRPPAPRALRRCGGARAGPDPDGPAGPRSRRRALVGTRRAGGRRRDHGGGRRAGAAGRDWPGRRLRGPGGLGRTHRCRLPLRDRRFSGQRPVSLHPPLRPAMRPKQPGSRSARWRNYPSWMGSSSSCATTGS